MLLCLQIDVYEVENKMLVLIEGSIDTVGGVLVLEIGYDTGSRKWEFRSYYYEMLNNWDWDEKKGGLGELETSLDEFGQVWDELGRVWTSSDKFVFH